MSVEENKKAVNLYHELNPDDVDTILTPDFTGHGPDGYTWNREDHKAHWRSRYGKQKHIIHNQIAAGDFVATRFSRTSPSADKPIAYEFMQIARFVNGQIAEMWECWES